MTPVMMNWIPTAGAVTAAAGAVLVAHVGADTCADRVTNTLWKCGGGMKTRTKRMNGAVTRGGSGAN